MSIIKGKNIVIGVTGCIAAYKIPELVRLFVKAEANVDVIMTESAAKFITPLTLSTLSKNKVHTGMFDRPDEFSIDHISLADKADLFLIAPATANVIGKIAAGIADDLLTTSVMAAKVPVVIAPAMNSNMWCNSIVQENINKLKDKSYKFIYPETGELACGYEGEGRLRNIDEIFAQINTIMGDDKPLSNKKILITVGPTREYIDPVRFISNKSSGKMGRAIAEQAVNYGADLTVITSVDMYGIKANIVEVESANDMQIALNKHFKFADVLIMTAAVADYTVKYYSEQKMKKDLAVNEINLELLKTPDLIADIAKLKKSNQLVIGFAAETEDLIPNAELKLKLKNLDMIVANDVSRNDIGMNSDYNEVTFIYPDGISQKLNKTSKNNVAKALLDKINDLILNKT